MDDQMRLSRLKHWPITHGVTTASSMTSSKRSTSHRWPAPIAVTIAIRLTHFSLCRYQYLTLFDHQSVSQLSTLVPLRSKWGSGCLWIQAALWPNFDPCLPTTQKFLRIKWVPNAMLSLTVLLNAFNVYKLTLHQTMHNKTIVLFWSCVVCWGALPMSFYEGTLYKCTLTITVRCINSYINFYVHVHCTYKRTHIHKFMHTCIHRCIHTCINTHRCACLYIVHVFVHAYAYTHVIKFLWLELWGGSVEYIRTSVI